MNSKFLNKLSKWKWNAIISILSLIFGIFLKPLVEILIIDRKLDINTLRTPLVLLIIGILIVIVLIIVSWLILLEKRKISGLILLEKKKINQTHDFIMDEIKNSMSFRCQLLTDQTIRIKMMIECIKKTQSRIYLLSSLSRAQKLGEIERPPKKLHDKFLKVLNDCIDQNGATREIDVVRVVTPPIDIDSNNSNAENVEPAEDLNLKKKRYALLDAYYQDVRNNHDYKEHFDLLSKNGSLRRFDQGPRGISILLIDNRYLFLVIETAYKEEDEENTTKIHERLANGFYFEDFDGDLTDNFEDCFKEIIRKGKPF